jgi:dolichol phosphate-mannose biosynthesis regulatory protein
LAPKLQDLPLIIPN